MAIAIAHRAPSDPAACAALAELGAAVFEIDVQIRGAGLVSSHFLPVHPVLPRLRRDRGRFTLRARSALEADLDRAIAAVPAGAAVLLDLKNDRGAAADALVSHLIGSDLDRAGHLVSTKGWQHLDLLREAGFRTWRTVADRAALHSVLGGPVLADDAVTVRHSLLTEAVVTQLRQRVNRVMTWTVNDAARARQLLEAGVDGITSDSAEVIRLVGATGSTHGAAPPG